MNASLHRHHSIVLLALATLLNAGCRSRTEPTTTPQPSAMPSPSPSSTPPPSIHSPGATTVPTPPPGMGPRGIGLAKPKQLPPPATPDPMVTVTGGTFEMGATDGFPDEVPVHPVTVAAFQMDVHEVTVEAYAACVKAGGCTPPGKTVLYDEQPQWKIELLSTYCNGLSEDRMKHPVNCIDFYQAEDYCRWQGKRLPSEEEWEYAARNGNQNTRYPWGNEPPDEKRLNAAGPECGEELSRRSKMGWNSLYPQSDGFAGTAPVGSFPEGANRWGVLDLMGNVFEYTSSEYCPYLQPKCGSNLMTARGGGWLVEMPKKARAARRNDDVMWHRSPDVGVRCAMSVK